MIFDDDASVLKEFIVSIRSQTDNRFHDTHDKDVDLYLNSSPLMMNSSFSYEAGSHDEQLNSNSKKEVNLLGALQFILVSFYLPLILFFIF